MKILDPACGSGAFPMGVLHKLVYILGKLDPDNERWKQTQLAKLDSAPTRSAWGKQYHEGKMDYWFFFLHRALEITKPKGVISYITSRYWINSTGSKKLIKHIQEKASLFHVVDIGALTVFSQVAGYHMLHFYKVDGPQSSCLVKRLENSLDDIALSVPTESLTVEEERSATG